MFFDKLYITKTFIKQLNKMGIRNNLNSCIRNQPVLFVFRTGFIQTSACLPHLNLKIVFPIITLPQILILNFLNKTVIEMPKKC